MAIGVPPVHHVMQLAGIPGIEPGLQPAESGRFRRRAEPNRTETELGCLLAKPLCQIAPIHDFVEKPCWITHSVSSPASLSG